MALVGQTYTINGIKVEFPCKAYPSQLSMMDKIIKGLERSQNCLLESPTGSGKSLALLCSALAWQQHEHDKLNEEDEEHKKECSCQCSGKNPPPDAATSTSGYWPGGLPQDGTVRDLKPVPSVSMLYPDGVDIEDADFKPQTKKLKNTTIQVGTPQRDVNSTTLSDVKTAPPLELSIPPSCSCSCNTQNPPARKRVPKIYFGTRTHKQITQIARELGKTAYKHVRMCILSSREHTCIDPEVSRMSHKGEECKNKLDGPGCKFFDKVRKISHRSIRDNGLDTAWDLEEFVGLCERSKACPYFGARQLKDGADIIFCPYNYLIDPLVRQSMEISLKNQIVIVDEAHNMEDSSREAASFTITQAKIQDAREDIQRIIDHQLKIEEHGLLHKMMTNFHELINQNIDHLEGSDFDHASKVWTGPEIIAQLKHLGTGPEELATLKRCYEAAKDDESETTKKGRDPRGEVKLRPPTLQAIEGLLMVMSYIYRNNMKFLEDYRIAIVRTIIYADVSTENRWMTKRRRAHREPTLSYNLHFWCLNPAVAFSDVGEVVRSVVLTSGTLSPLDTFQSELSAPFPIQLEANHVISKSQIWVGTISKGPRGASLLGSYQNSETLSYQDDVGAVVLSVCQTVPYGVLCFLPSYKSMEKLCNRWKLTGLWARLSDHKQIMMEPRASDKVDFDNLMKNFYEVINHHSNTDLEEQGITGAIFLAVCRGKVSEGLDFADNNARAVITVGIPYPNIKDTQIELKKQYNDQRSSTRGLLPGRFWYETQAYRAINQALGRCIRHRNDWGALILVDDRYAKNPNKYIKGLSKWVRNHVQYYSNFQQAENSLKSFTQQRLIADAAEDVSILQTSHTSMSESHIVNSYTNGTETPTQQTKVTSKSSMGSSETKQRTSLGIREKLLLSTGKTPQHRGETPQHRGETPHPQKYVLLSQAGGFLVSQTPDKPAVVHPTAGLKTVFLQPTQSAAQLEMSQIQAGNNLTQLPDLTLNSNEAVINFNPPLASTQITKTPSGKQVCQMPSIGTPALTPITGSAGDRTPLQTRSGMVKGKLNFTTTHSKSPAQQHTALQSANNNPHEESDKLRCITNSSFKFVSVPKNKPSDGDSRSSSPGLFDSDEGEEGPALDTAPGHNTKSTTVSSRKPLFKKPADKVGTEPEMTVAAELVDPKCAVPRTEQAPTRPLRRLSRCRLSKGSNESKANTTILTECPAQCNEEIPMETERKVTEAVSRQIEDGDATLNIRRAAWSKKRNRSGNIRMSAKRTKGIHFEDDDDEDTCTKPNAELQIVCPVCRAELTTLTGPVLNCHWSVTDGGVIQFLGCQQCVQSAHNPSKGRDLPPCLAAQVMMLTENHNPRLQKGQVWLLPECVQASHRQPHNASD